MGPGNYTRSQIFQIVKNHYKDNELGGFEEETEATINEIFELLIDQKIKYFKDYFFTNLSEPFTGLFRAPNKEEVSIKELPASCAGEVTILALNDDYLVLAINESKHCHYLIDLVPNFKFEYLSNEIWNKHIDKKPWYDRRAVSYDNMVDKLAKKSYEKKIMLWRKKYEPFMKYFYSMNKNILS